MSFGLAVLAMDESADAATARAMFERCTSDNHDEGELDERVVGFYERLRSRFPDRPPYAAESPWMSTPLEIGIDHVIMNPAGGQGSRSSPWRRSRRRACSGVDPAAAGGGGPGATAVASCSLFRPSPPWRRWCTRSRN